MVIAVLAAGCATTDTNQPTANDEADVRFMQYMAGHLLQTTSILDLAGERITRLRLADTINSGDKPIRSSSKHGWPAADWPLTTLNNSPAAERNPTLNGCPRLTTPARTLRG